MAKPAKKVDLAVIFGGAKKPPKAAEDEAEDMAGDDESSDDEKDSGLPEDFKTAASEAFPDLDDEKLASFWRAIKACVEADEHDEHEYDEG